MIIENSAAAAREPIHRSEGELEIGNTERAVVQEWRGTRSVHKKIQSGSGARQEINVHNFRVEGRTNPHVDEGCRSASMSNRYAVRFLTGDGDLFGASPECGRPTNS